MNTDDIKHLLSAIHYMQAARQEIEKIGLSGRGEIQQPQLIDELMKLEDEALEHFEMLKTPKLFCLERLDPSN